MAGSVAPVIVNGSVIPSPSPSSGNFSFLPVYCSFPRLNSPENALCGHCAEGYLSWGASCVHCEGPNYPLLCLLLVASFGLVLLQLRNAGDVLGKGLLTVLLYLTQNRFGDRRPGARLARLDRFVNPQPARCRNLPRSTRSIPTIPCCDQCTYVLAGGIIDSSLCA